MFSHKFGMGCDQIVGARVVRADGSVVRADERLLMALRGAGPAFGVVVEVEIKVYPKVEVRLPSFPRNVQRCVSSVLTVIISDARRCHPIRFPGPRDYSLDILRKSSSYALSTAGTPP